MTTITLTEAQSYTLVMSLYDAATYWSNLSTQSERARVKTLYRANSDRAYALAEQVESQLDAQQRARAADAAEANSQGQRHRGVKTGQTIVATIGTPVRAGGSTPLADWQEERDR